MPKAITAIEGDPAVEGELIAAETFAQFGEGFKPAWQFKNTQERLQEELTVDRGNVPPAAVHPWECRIGGSRFFVPPLSINVSQVFKAGNMAGSVIRQQNPPKFNTGHTETVINMTLYFPNYEEIWGYEDEIFNINFEDDSEEKIDSFLSSLRGLIAQFKYAPFLPVRNTYLNQVFGITGVVLKDMSISTVPNFPLCVAVNLTLLKFNHKVYLPMVEHFDQAIHWGRFRQYMGRAAGRLAQSAKPIKAFSNSNRPPKQPMGDIIPSVRTAEDILGESRTQSDEILSEQTYNRHGPVAINRLDFFFPFHTPARVDLPDLSGLVPSSVVRGRRKKWWEQLLGVIGIDVNTVPDAHYSKVSNMSESQGTGHIVDVREVDILMRYFRLINLSIQYMNVGEMNKYISRRLQEEGITPGSKAAEEFAANIRQTWFYVMYRMFLEDPLMAEALSRQDQRRRQLSINEWEIPMWRLRLDSATVKIQGISVSMGNSIARLQLQMQDEPTHQHIGGEGTRLDISLIVSGERAEQELVKLRTMFESISGLARLEHGHGVLGFMGVQSALTALCGMRYAVPLAFEVDTIPNFPHTYEVRISMTDFDVFQQKRETLSAEQQAELVEAFGKRNPFLRLKQMWGMINAYPDFPLAVRDDEGKIVGHLDPDYYFRSFKTIDDDLIESDLESPAADAVRRSMNRENFIEEDGVHICVGVDENGNSQYASVKDGAITLRSGSYVHVDSGRFMDVTSGNTITEPTVEGLTPASQHTQQYFGGATDPTFQFSTMAKDMQYRDKSGRMVRAFPTYMMWLIDEGGTFAGMKLFDNFYGLQSVLDLSIVQSEDILGDTLVIRISNLYSKLSTKFHDYLEAGEPHANIINHFMTRQHRLLSGTGNYLVDLDTIQVRPGIRLHLRLGYGSDPNRLETVFNGTITEVHTGEIMTLVAQSDAMELSALVNSTNQKGHSGKIDGTLFGFHMSEPRDLMCTLLTMGSSRSKEVIAHALRGMIFSENRFGIKHFGSILYVPLGADEREKSRSQREHFALSMANMMPGGAGDLATGSQSILQSLPGLVSQQISSLVGGVRENLATKRDYEIFKRNIYPGNGTGVAQFMGGDLGDIGLNMAIDGSATVVSGAGLRNDGSPMEILIQQASDLQSVNIPQQDESPRSSGTNPIGPTFSGILGGAASTGLRGPGIVEPLTSPAGRNILDTMGILNSGSDPTPFPEVAFRAQTYMKTVWDLFKVCAALLPDYIVAVRPFEERSTVFYGKPHWLYTSGVIPLSSGTEQEPVTEFDEEAHIIAEMNAAAAARDETDTLEEFFHQAGSYPSDPTQSTGGVSVGDVSGARLAARAAYAAGFRGEDLVTMVAIAGAESTWNPNAKNRNTTATGLWQIMFSVWKDTIGISNRDELTDPLVNARAAKLITEQPLAKRFGKFSDWAVHPDSANRKSADHPNGFFTPNNTYADHLPAARAAVEAELSGVGAKPGGALDAVNQHATDLNQATDIAVVDNSKQAIARRIYMSIEEGDEDSKPFRTDEDAESAWKEFRQYFSTDQDTERKFMGSRHFEGFSRGDKEKIRDENLDSIANNFIDFMWNDPYARGWLVLVSDQRVKTPRRDIVDEALRRATGIDGVGFNTRKWDFGLVYDLFAIWIDDGDQAAFEFMKSNLNPGLPAASWRVRQMQRVGRAVSRTWDRVKDVMEAVKTVASGLINHLTMSLMQLSQGLSAIQDVQRQSNTLNSIYNDSIYYSAGVVDGNVVNPLLYYADNPFTREYAEPVAEIREPFQRLHTLGSFQHIVSNNIIETIDDVASVVTATSNGEHPVTVHFDKGAPADKQFEKVVDTGLHWDTPKGFWSNLNPLNAFPQHRRSQMIQRGVTPTILAKRAALSHLKENLKDIYQGELVVLGDASIRPHDLVYLGDVYERTYGLFEVEQVVHHLSPETGFVTSITPNACVTINDPARFSFIAEWRGKRDIQAVRDHMRASVSGTKVGTAQDLHELSAGGTESLRNKDISLTELEEMVEQELKGSVQYFGGSSHIIKSFISGLVVTGGGVFAWPAWRWVRDNLLDQHGCMISYLTKNGQRMDAGLSQYNQGVAVGHQWSTGIVLKGLKIGEISHFGPNGEAKIRYEDIVGGLQWDETGPSENAAEISWFVEKTIAAVRGIARNSPFIENFASEVYWVKVTNVWDGDTFKFNVLGHIRHGEFEFRNMSIGDNTLRLAAVDAPEDNFKFDPERAALAFNDRGVRATNYAKEHLLDKEVAIRIVNTERTESGFVGSDRTPRTLGMVFHNAPDGLEGEERRDWILRAAGSPPVAAWDGYMQDGKPYTFNWQLVAAGLGHMYTNDLKKSVPGSGVRGSR